MEPHSQSSDVAPAEPPIFAARYSPHRSLSKRGFNILMGAAFVASLAIGIVFLSMGAWPIFGFFGLDVVLLYVAFRRNYADARAVETIDLTATELIVRRVSPWGRRAQYSFNPYWTRLVVDRRGWGVAAVALASSGRRLIIGAFLSPNERAKLADALSAALDTARTSAPV